MTAEPAREKIGREWQHMLDEVRGILRRPSVAEVPPRSEDERMRAFAELAKLTQELKMGSE